MSPKRLEKELEDLKSWRKNQISKEDFEKARKALEAAHIPPPYKAILPPDVDRP